MIDLSSIDVSAFPHWLSPGGEVLLINADCMDVLPLLEPGSVDAVVTDPPYGVDFQGKNTKHTKRNDSGYISGDDAGIGPRVVEYCISRGWRAVVTPGIAIAFDYPKPVEIGGVFCPSGAGLGRWGFIGTHPILYYGKCPYLANGMGHRPNSFSSFATQAPNGHPCPKPEAWMQWLVRKASAYKGDIILDPFAGSGTTAIACIRTGRRSISIEKEPKYCEIAKRRIEEVIGVGTLFDPAALAAPDLFEETQ